MDVVVILAIACLCGLPIMAFVTVIFLLITKPDQPKGAQLEVAQDPREYDPVILAGAIEQTVSLIRQRLTDSQDENKEMKILAYAQVLFTYLPEEVRAIQVHPGLTIVDYKKQPRKPDTWSLDRIESHAKRIRLCKKMIGKRTA